MAKRSLGIILIAVLCLSIVYSFNISTATSTDSYFDDFNGAQLSTGWKVENGIGDYTLNNGIMTLSSSTSSGGEAVTIYRDYMPQTDEFTVSARVSSDRLAGFALRIQAGPLPIFGSTQGAQLEIDNGVENKNFMASWNAGSWTWTNVYSPVATNVWFILEMQVQRNPFTITYNVYSDSGTLLGTLSTNNIGFSYDSINYICLEAWTSPTAYNIDWVRVESALTQTPLTPIPTSISTGPTATFIPTTTPVFNSGITIFNLNPAIFISILLAAFFIILLGYLLIMGDKKKNWKLSKEKLAELIKINGRIELAEASKVTGVKASKIKKLFSELFDENSVAQGFFVNDDKEFVTESLLVNWVSKTGKFSFADFGLTFGLVESEAKEIIQDLFNEKKLKGAFTLDAQGFVTEDRLIGEIGKDMQSSNSEHANSSNNWVNNPETNQKSEIKPENPPAKSDETNSNSDANSNAKNLPKFSLLESEEIELELENDWQVIQHGESFEWSKSMFHFELLRKPLLTNKRIVLLKDNEIDFELPIDLLNSVEVKALFSGNSYLKLHLKNGDVTSFMFVCTGAKMFLGTFYLAGKYRTILNQWVESINRLIIAKKN